MASTVNFPAQPPPPPSSDNGPTMIIVVFISLGTILFLAFCLCALWCLITKMKKKTVQEIDRIRADEHFKVKEDIVEGSHGPEAMVLSIEDDKHVEGEIIKNEKLGGKKMHAKHGEINRTDLEDGESSSNTNTRRSHHHLEFKN